MRYLTLVSLLLVSACPRTGAVKTSPTRDTVRYAALLESDDAEVIAAPTPLHERIVGVLDRRNLEATPMAIAPSALGTPSETRDRIGLLLDDGGDAFLLVETSAHFSVQVNGRYRWNVEAEISLVTGGDATNTRSATIRVPVALVYSHQGAEEALAEAAPLVARRLAGLVDEWLASRRPASG